MPRDITLSSNVGRQHIHNLLQVAGLVGFTGDITPLGGGEGNDTFVVAGQDSKVVLRIARYPGVSNLSHEATALSLLNLDQVPKLLYFDESQPVMDRAWIAESYLDAVRVEKLNISQFAALGRLLARIHKVHLEKPMHLDFWHSFLETKKHFGDEQAFLSHPDPRLAKLIRKSYDYFRSQDFGMITPSLTHGDLSLSNMLVKNNSVSLIDWEYSRFRDPMADFSTMFYDDMEYNAGMWRIRITAAAKKALFAGYAQTGGIIDKQRLRVWLISDKLGGAVYLFWKLHGSSHEITSQQTSQYQEDLEKLLESLERNL